MKTIFRLSLMAILFFAVSSCKKSDFSDTPKDNPPLLNAKIYHFITEPTTMEMGTPQSTINTGDWVTVFVPYDINNEEINDAKITITNDADGGTIAVYDLVPYTDASASSLELPSDDLNHTPYMFARFNADNNYTGKTISLHTSFKGGTVTSNDDLNAALIVQ